MDRDTDRKLIDEYQRLHAAGSYGDTGNKSLPDILSHILALAPGSLVDYGCGQSGLAGELGRKAKIANVCRYDPAIAGLATRPQGRFDLLVNIDVLEHVPDSEIDAVAADMASLARDALIVVDTGPAVTKLSDGRDAHVSQHGEAWWLARLRPHFPTLRPMPVARKRRVGFKTFDAALSPLAHMWISQREHMLRRAARLMRRFAA